MDQITETSVDFTALSKEVVSPLFPRDIEPSHSSLPYFQAILFHLVTPRLSRTTHGLKRKPESYSALFQK